MISIFETRKLMQIVRYLHPVKTPLLSLFFNKAPKQSDTRDLQIDFVRNTRRLAPFVGAKMKGQQIDKKDWETKSIRPPYIKILDVTTATDVLDRVPGKTIYQSPVSPARRAREILTQESQKFIDMIQRRIEWMAHEVLTTQGDVTFSGEGVSVTIDFGMPVSHKIALTGTDKWSDAGSTPLQDLDDWNQLNKKDTGILSDSVVFDNDAANLFLNHADIKGNDSVFNNRRMEMGKIDPRMLPDGLQYIGTLKKPDVDIYAYSEYYENDSLVVTPIMPSNTVIMGSTRAASELYFGAIEDLDVTAAVPFFPKSKKKWDPSAQLLLMQSAPLPAPLQLDSFVSATVD